MQFRSLASLDGSAALIHDHLLVQVLRASTGKHYFPVFLETSTRQRRTQPSGLDWLMDRASCGSIGDSALSILSRIAELKLSDPRFQISYGAACITHGRTEAGLYSFLSAARRAPPGAVRSRALANAAAAFERLRRYDEALHYSLASMAEPVVDRLAVRNYRALRESRVLDRSC